MQCSYYLAPLVPFAVVLAGCTLLGGLRNGTVTASPAAAPPGQQEWQVDGGITLTHGPQKRTSGFLAGGQIHAALLSQSDPAMGPDTAAQRQRWKSYPEPAIAPSADSWQTGPASLTVH